MQRIRKIITLLAALFLIGCSTSDYKPVTTPSLIVEYKEDGTRGRTWVPTTNSVVIDTWTDVVTFVDSRTGNVVVLDSSYQLLN